MQLTHAVLVVLLIVAFPLRDAARLQHKPLGQHGVPEGVLTSIQWPSVEAEALLEPERFWNDWMRTMKPVMIRNVSSRFPATHKWTDEYLIKNFGDLVVRLEKKNESQYVQDIPDRVSLSSYFNELQSVGYVVSQLPSPMSKDVEVMPFLACGPNKDSVVEVDLWISSGATHSLLHKDAFNQVNCLLKGTKHWVFVDPDHTKNVPMYYESGPPEDALAGKSKLDPLKVNLKRYPKFAKVPFHKDTQHAGDCLFLPGSYLHQVFAEEGRSVAVSTLFGGPTSLTRYHGLSIPAFNRSSTACPDVPRNPSKSNSDSAPPASTSLTFPNLSDMFIAWDYSGQGPMTMGIGLPDDATHMLLQLLNPRQRKRMRKKAFLKAYRQELVSTFPTDSRFHSDDLNTILDSLVLLIPSRSRDSWNVVKTHGDSVCEIPGAKEAAFEQAVKQADAWYDTIDPENKGLTEELIKNLTPRQLMNGLTGFFYLQGYAASALSSIGEQATTYNSEGGREKGRERGKERGRERGRRERGRRGREERQRRKRKRKRKRRERKAGREGRRGQERQNIKYGTRAEKKATTHDEL